MFTFNGKVVWVTGSVTGIGRAMALEFAKHGADVVIHNFDRKEEALELLGQLESEGTNVLLVEGDVTDKIQVEQMVEQIKARFGRLDILVNNVGASPYKVPFEELEEEIWDEMINLNLKSVYLVTRAAIPLIKAGDKGKIVNVCSSVVRNGGIIGGLAYTTAKGGVEALTRALAKQFAQNNILVNGVAPGLVDTPFHKTKIEETHPQLIDKIPLKRMGRPYDLAGATLFLASDYSDYITGEIIEVSGGTKLS